MADNKTCARCKELMDPMYGKYCEGCQEWMAEARMEMEGEIEFERQRR